MASLMVETHLLLTACPIRGKIESVAAIRDSAAAADRTGCNIARSVAQSSAMPRREANPPDATDPPPNVPQQALALRCAPAEDFEE